MNRICFMVDSWFFGEHSGIYTFIKHYAKMVSLMEDYTLDIITDYDVPAKYQNDNSFTDVNFISGVITDKYSIGVRSDAILAYRLKLAEYLENNEPVVIVSHSFTATKALVDTETSSRKMIYTHIGDILDGDKTSLYDFSDEEVVDHLTIISNTKDLYVGTQNDKLAEVIGGIIKDHSRVLSLPEPFYYGKVKEGQSNGPILLLSSNYRRKKLELMLSKVAEANKGVSIIAGLWEEESCTPINELIVKYRLTSASVYRQIPNKHVHRHIAKSSAMLHLSEIEVMPYAVMESMLSVPVIINKDAVWAQCFPFKTPYRVSVDEVIDFDTIIKNHDLDAARAEIEAYARHSEKSWADFLKGGTND